METRLWHRYIEAFVDPRLQLVGMIISSLAIAAILYGPMMQFTSQDPKPALIPYTLEKHMNSKEIPKVDVGLSIINFPVLDITRNAFTLDALVWFEFDPSLVSLDRIKRFSFDKGTILSKSEPDMKLINGRLFVRYTIRLQFTSDLNYKLFPLDDHRVFILLKNDYVSPQELSFNVTSSSFTISPYMRTHNWKVIDHAVEAGYFSSTLDKYDQQKTVAYPGVLFSLDFATAGARKAFIILLPVTLLLFIASLSLTLHSQALTRTVLTLSVGALTGLIAYRFVLENIIPDVGYFTLADNIFNLVLTSIFFIFLINIYTARKNDAHVTAFIKGATFLVTQIVLVGGLYLMLHHL